jgi:actin-like ATPase involved in cell morphogenesis
MKLTAKPQANPAVLQRKTPDGEVVLVNLDTGASVALNLTGVIVWKLVDGQRNVEQIVTAVRQSFTDAPPETINDVSNLMDILAEDGFIGFEWPSNLNPENKETTK